MVRIRSGFHIDFIGNSRGLQLSSLAFTQGFSTIIFFLAYFTWIGSEFIGAFLIPHLRRRGKTQVKRDRGSAGLIILSVFVSITVAFNLGMAGVGLLPDWIFYFGIVFMFIGVLVRQYAIAVLGKFFSLSVRVADDHRVVNTAPYRYVRHPSYTGVMLTFIGLALVVQSWV